MANEDPAVKIPQIKKAVAAGDRTVEPQLLKDLDDDDAAVRFYAIEALVRFNGGGRLGYDWKVADRHQRRPAVMAWYERLGIESPTTPPADTERP